MKILAVLVPVLLSAAAALAQTPAAIPRATFHSGAAVVALNVIVQDQASHYVSGVRPEDFAVYEDGVKQEIAFCEARAVPVDLIVLIDASSSMTDKMELAHDAASGFLRNLRPGDRGAVVSFADTVSVVQPLTADLGALQRAVASTHASGLTALDNAIYIALKTFGQAERGTAEVRRQAIVVLSDGEDTSSLVSFDDVLAARHTGVNIYTVSVRSRYTAEQLAAQGQKDFQDPADYGMRTLARETGAEAFFPDPSQLRTVYSAIAADLASQYSIGYVPANPTRDGAFHKVGVQVVTRPELHVRTRAGYTAERGT